MEKKECVAMILAGKHNERLGALNDCLPKPAMFYGGNYRIIDFALSNCSHSGIDTIGVLTRLSGDLQLYIGDGRAWKLPSQGKGVFVLPPETGKDNYKGAADAIYRNIDFIERADPRYVCVLSGDHIYKMDYTKMLDFHKKNNADVTIASTLVPFSETHRHGILYADDTGFLLDYEEKPRSTRSNMASMGIYIFNWGALRKHLMADNARKESHNDLGTYIIPAMISAGENIYTWRFDGYWRDLDTVESLWKSNMDLLGNPPRFTIQEKEQEVFSFYDSQPSYFSGKNRTFNRSILAGSHIILGNVEHSVVSDSVVVEKGAEVVDSVLMPNVYIGKNAKIYKTIVGPNSHIMNDVEIGAENGMNSFVNDHFCTGGVSLVASWVRIAQGARFQKNSHIPSGVTIENTSGVDFTYVDRWRETNEPVLSLRRRSMTTRVPLRISVAAG